MTTNGRTAAILAALILTALPATVRADGIIVAHPPSPPEGPSAPPPHTVRPLAVKRHIVNVEIKGALCNTRVDETFHNPNDMVLEGTYLFPLPEGASVSDFKLYIDGVPVEAELLDADKARKIYEDIVRRMKDPALLEYAGRNLFKARVYPIPANGSRRIVLSYSETLSPDASVWTYRYPLDTEKFSSAPIETVRITVTADPGRKVASVYSTSHPSGRIEKTSPSSFRYTFEAADILPDKDFYLHFVTSGRKISAAPLVHRVKGEDGYFMLLVSAGEAPEGEALPKDIVFVMDTSGSMRGAKIRQAKAALEYCIKGLSEKDRFEIVPFSTEARPLFGDLKPASEDNTASALEAVRRIRASGGTNIEDALSSALKILSERNGSGRPSFVIFLTDGMPTIGERRVEPLVRKVLDRKGRARIFVFGVGNNLNAVLLDRLAADTRGVKTYVGDNEDLELKLSSFFSKISRPALTDVVLEIKGVRTYDIYPRRIGDIFYGQEVVLLGRVKGAGKASIIIKGKRGGKAVTLENEAVFPADSTVPGLARLWAARKIAFLLEQIRLEGETADLKKEVVRLARKFGVITPYTSMLVVEDEASAGPGAPVPLADTSVRRKAAEARKRFLGEAGAGAVAASRSLNAMQQIGTSPAAAPGAPQPSLEEKLVMEEARGLVKRVSDKTFYKNGDFWEDAAFRPDMKTVEVAYLSKEYFELLKKHPEAGKYLAVGPKLVVVLDGTAYQIK